MCALAEAGAPGALYRGLRLVAYDGTTLDGPDERGNREAFGLPGGGCGKAAFPKVRVTALVELGTLAALAWEQGPYRESEKAQALRLEFGQRPVRGMGTVSTVRTKNATAS